jgi:hypothetical protein
VKRLGRAWESFWLAEGETTALGLFRILFACCLLLEVHASQIKSVNAIDDGLFHLPYTGLISPMPESVYHALHALQPPLIALIALGLLTRLSCAALFAVQGWLFFADRLNFRNHPYLFLLVLGLLALSPAGEALSVPAAVRALREGSRRLFGGVRPLTWQRLIQLQVALAYLFAGLHKLHPAYLRGDVLRELARTEWPAAAPWPDGWLMAVAWATVAIELTLPFGLWFSKTRPACVLAGLLFHLAVAWTLGIHVFSVFMLASYLLFFNPRILAKRARRAGVALLGESSGAG